MVCVTEHKYFFFFLLLNEICERVMIELTAVQALVELLQIMHFKNCIKKVSNNKELSSPLNK